MNTSNLTTMQIGKETLDRLRTTKRQVSAKLDRDMTHDEVLMEVLDRYDESMMLKKYVKYRDTSKSKAGRLLLKLSSSRKQLMIWDPTLEGGKYMLFIEPFLNPLLDGTVDDVYAEWIPDKKA